MQRDREAHRIARRAVAKIEIGDIPPDPSVDPLPFTMSRRAKSLVEMRKKMEGAAIRPDPKLPTAPSINALSFTIRYLPGGRERFLEFVKLAALNGDPSAEAWWKVYADLTPYVREETNFDDICVAAGVKPSALLSGVVGHGMEAGKDMGRLMAAVLHPEVVAAAGKSAVRINGPHAQIAAEDRRQLLQAQGLLPVPKGASIHLHANANANAQAAAATVSDPSVPKFADDMSFLSTPVKQLPEGDGDVIDLTVAPATVER